MLIGWRELARTCGVHEPASAVGRHRLSTLLRLQRLVADLGGAAADRLHAAAVLVALPVGHVDHLGRSWVMDELAGGALELGLGLRGLIGGPDAVVALPPALATTGGLDVESWWPQVRQRAEAMSAVAVEHLSRDGRGAGTIRPVGGYDVLALLTGSALRTALADQDATGMCALAVPTRRRAWYDLARIDPAFVSAAWLLTDPLDRGVDVPILVTKDEVALPAPGGRPVQQALDDA